MDFSESLKDMFSRLVIKSDKLSNEEKDRLLHGGISDPIIDKEPVFFQFDKDPILEAEFLGNAPDYMDEGKPVPCWKFKDKTGTIYHVPKYTQLNAENKNFKGFDKEVPGERIYKIVYTGEKEIGGGGFVYEFTVFTKLK